MKLRKFDLGLFGRYRAELMGVATLLIIICHMAPNGVVMPTVLRYIFANGGAGCDVFLFLSGFGICNSLHSNAQKGKSVWFWYYRRYMRLFIPCALIIIPFNIYVTFPDSCNWFRVLFDASGFGYLFKAGTLWYVSCTLLLYLLTPFLDKPLSCKYKWRFVSGLSLLSLLFGYFSSGENSILHPWQFCIQRFPNYFIAYAMTSEIMQCKKNGSLWLFVILPAIYCVISFAINKMFDANISYFWTQGIVFLTISTLIIDKLHSNRLNSFLRFVGVISLESYATNVIILPYFKNVSWYIGNVNLNYGGWTYYITATIICLFISYFINKISIKALNFVFAR